jgi:methylenetetrahydrofolate dehydrogenase (NADP+) / methenyltetrahydrofolate cyclohydrolase
MWMTAQIFDGKRIVKDIRGQIAEEVAKLKEQGVQPGLAVVLVGDDPASHIYVNNKEKACLAAGMYSEVHRLPAETSQEELIQLVQRLNADPNIHGILVQSPQPDHIDERAVIDAIAVEKDVDGFHPINVGNLVLGGADCFVACTPKGVLELIKLTGIEISGKHAVVVGRSHIVGKPMALLLLQENATVTVCHSKTQDLAAMTKQADILIAAVGRPRMIKREHVKPGAVVIDVGINRLPDGKVCGDVDFDDVVEVAGHITPVPGVVGPMTITMLLRNTVESAQRAQAAARS